MASTLEGIALCSFFDFKLKSSTIQELIVLTRIYNYPSLKLIGSELFVTGMAIVIMGVSGAGKS